jgi:hypothetical protein
MPGQSNDQTALETRARRFTTENLRAIRSFDDLQALVESRPDIVVANASDFGTGFSILDTKDKASLVGEYLAILDWRFNNGDQGEFVSAEVLVRNGNRKFVLNDGSTGICQQLKDIQHANGGETCLLIVPRGLRVSEYDYVDAGGNTSKARTYYIDYSK